MEVSEKAFSLAGTETNNYPVVDFSTVWEGILAGGNWNLFPNEMPVVGVWEGILAGGNWNGY